MSEKKIAAMAVAAIAEETGRNICNLCVVSFKKIEKSSLTEYLETNHIPFKKYQLGDA